MFQSLLTELVDGTYIITINRPDKLNALNALVIEELSAAINEIYANPSIKSAIITGAGAKAFVAGADISEFLSLDAEAGKALAAKGQHKVFDKIENAPKPIVAAVNGFALGGGCELAMACHFRLASENAKFGQPEVNLGLIPGYGGTQRLTQLIGKGKAMELMMTGEMIDAATAQNVGLVNHVFPLDELLPKAKEMMQKIQSKAPLAIAKVIETVNAMHNEKQNGYALEIDGFGALSASADMKEGVTAFLEKRKAVFVGK